MGRARQPEIRRRLLETCTDLVLDQGTPEHLQPFADACGTSPRMLLYHFGTRTGLLREVLRNARLRQRAEFEELLRPRPGEDYRDRLAAAFRGITGTPGQRYVDVFDRLREDERQQLWPGFRREATTDWLEPLEEGLATLGRADLATLVLAVIRGLIMDLGATGDRRRADEAFDHFIALLGQPAATGTAPEITARA